MKRRQALHAQLCVSVGLCVAAVAAGCSEANRRDPAPNSREAEAGGNGGTQAGASGAAGEAGAGQGSKGGNGGAQAGVSGAAGEAGAGRGSVGGTGEEVFPQAGRAAPPIPFTPGECTLHRLDPASACSEASSCPVELAGHLDCIGPGNVTDLMLQDGQLLTAMSFLHTSRGSPLIAMRIDPRTDEFSWLEVGEYGGGWWRLARGEPVLLGYYGAELIPHRVDARFETLEPGAPHPFESGFDVYYDADGSLHVFSTDPSRIRPHLDGVQLAETTLMTEATTLLADGSPALASLVLDNSRVSVRLWTPAAGDREVRSVEWPDGSLRHRELQIAVAPRANAPEGPLISFSVDGTVLTQGTRFDSTALLGTPRVSVCAGRIPRQASTDLCPEGATTAELDEHVIDHRLLVDDATGPWLFALAVKGKAVCDWYTPTSCAEDSLRPCDCRQLDSIELREPAIVLRSISEQVQSFRLPLGDAPLGRLLGTPLAGGSFFAAYTYASEDEDGKHHTHLRYYRIQLSPQ
jgi:hypothetical protein